jgi:hypothetical protein
MIEIIILDYLKGVLDVPVYTEKQNEMPSKYVFFEKTNGTQENFISFATIAIQSYAPSLYEAALLNEEVKRVMNDIITLDSISKSKLNSDYSYTDTAKKQYRYQAVYDLVFY